MLLRTGSALYSIFGVLSLFNAVAQGFRLRFEPGTYTLGSRANQ